MTIGIDIRALSGRRAGKGWSVYHILKNLTLLPEAETHQFVLYAKEPPGLDFPLPRNFIVRTKKGPGLLWHLAVARELGGARGVDVYLSPVSFIVPVLSRQKCVLIVNDLVAKLFPSRHNRKATIIENLTLKPALKKSRAIVAISESTRRDLEKYYPGTQRKITVVPLAGRDRRQTISAAAEEHVQKKYHLPEHFLLSVGTLEPRKNIVRVVQAFDRVKDDLGADLVLAGSRGWHWQEIFETIRHGHLEKRVHYLGYVPPEDLLSLYHLADQLVFPSLYEGFGLPVLEAMAAGCPVVTSNVSSLPEVSGSAAVLVDPRNVDAIARGIKEGQRRQAELVARGLEQARKFSWEQTARQILTVLTENNVTGK